MGEICKRNETKVILQPPRALSVKTSASPGRGAKPGARAKGKKASPVGNESTEGDQDHLLAQKLQLLENEALVSEHFQIRAKLFKSIQKTFLPGSVLAHNAFWGFFSRRMFQPFCPWPHVNGWKGRYYWAGTRTQLVSKSGTWDAATWLSDLLSLEQVN